MQPLSPPPSSASLPHNPSSSAMAASPVAFRSAPPFLHALSRHSSSSPLPVSCPMSPLTATHGLRTNLWKKKPPAHFWLSRHTGIRLHATTSDDEWGEDPGTGENVGVDVAAATAVADDSTSVQQLKQALIDSLYGTDRGLKATSETRAEIVELITQLEAKNPTPAPTEALTLLNGKWILAYTSFSELFPLLATGILPLVKVGEISQTIDSEALTVQNSVSFTGPLATTSFSTSASFEVRSPKRVQIKFEEGVIGTPQLTDAIDIPETVDFLGQKIDLTPVQGLLKSLQDAASSVARRISGQPPLKFPIRGDRAQSWLLTTYLDEDLRISRGDGGSIFVLIKEGSLLLN